MVKCKQLARDLVYWPGINKQIEDMVSRCSTCQEHRSKQQKEPMMPTKVPSRAWEHVAQDLCDCLGHKWLVTVDYYSEFFEVTKLEDATGATVIEKTKQIFSVHGIPSRLTSDNGPPFNSYEYASFAETYGFEHITSSPRYPQSNGMAEKAVGIAKRILIKCHESGADPYVALLNHRNTPRDSIVGSPAQRLFNRRTKTQLPTAPILFKPKIQEPELVQKQLTEYREKAKMLYDRGSKPLQPLHPGEEVRVRTEKSWTPAKVVNEGGSTQPRSYNVLLPTGRTWRRNRRDLMKGQEGIFHRRYEDYLENESQDLDVQYPASPRRTPQSPSHYNPPRPPDPISPPPNTAQNSPNPVLRSPVRTRSGRTVKQPSYLSNYQT